MKRNSFVYQLVVSLLNFLLLFEYRCCFAFVRLFLYFIYLLACLFVLFPLVGCNEESSFIIYNKNNNNPNNNSEERKINYFLFALINDDDDDDDEAANE